MSLIKKISANLAGAEPCLLTRRDFNAFVMAAASLGLLARCSPDDASTDIRKPSLKEFLRNRVFNKRGVAFVNDYYLRYARDPPTVKSVQEQLVNQYGREVVDFKKKAELTELLVSDRVFDEYQRRMHGLVDAFFKDLGERVPSVTFTRLTPGYAITPRENHCDIYIVESYKKEYAAFHRHNGTQIYPTGTLESQSIGGDAIAQAEFYCDDNAKTITFSQTPGAVFVYLRATNNIAQDTADTVSVTLSEVLHYHLAPFVMKGIQSDLNKIITEQGFAKTKENLNNIVNQLPNKWRLLNEGFTHAATDKWMRDYLLPQQQDFTAAHIGNSYSAPNASPVYKLVRPIHEKSFSPKELIQVFKENPARILE